MNPGLRVSGGGLQGGDPLPPGGNAEDGDGPARQECTWGIIRTAGEGWG